MVSADGRCRPFDAAASGTLFGSGAGVVLLKRLEDAIADGDHIYAVILGCGVNNDGASKVGFTAPSIEGQAAAIEEALAQAGADARSIGYVECHGTATPLGDPIEIAALTKAFRQTTAERQYCAIGSVKGNIGHLDAAAGVAGLIKAALMLKHRESRAELAFRARPTRRSLLPAAPFSSTPGCAAWPRRLGAAARGVSSSGSAAPTPMWCSKSPAAAAPSGERAGRAQLLRAVRPIASRAGADAVASWRHICGGPELSLADIASTLQRGRRHFSSSLRAVPARTRRMRGGCLRNRAPRRTPGRGVRQAPPSRLHVPRTGRAIPGYGRGALPAIPAFRAGASTCAPTYSQAWARPASRRSIRARRRSAQAERLASHRNGAAGAFSRSNTRWPSCGGAGGSTANAFVGHSVGEFVAACLAGVFSLADALVLVAARGRLMEELPRGAMLGGAAGRRPRCAPLAPRVSLAAINSPTHCVLAGPIEALASDREATRGARRRLPPAAYLARLPLADDGPDDRAVRRAW